MTDEKAPALGTAKKHSNFFAAVRKRGVLNTMLDEPVKLYEAAHPGWRARWEYCPASGDKTFIVAREGLGFHVVEAEELGESTPSGQKSGPVKVGDLILMAAEEHIVEAIAMEDAKIAYEDWRTPQTTYEESIRGLKVRLKDGSEKETQPVGDIRVTTEVIGAPPGTGMDHPLEKE